MQNKIPLGFIVILGLVGMITPLAIDLYLPAMPAMAASLGTAETTVQMTLSAYLVGFALGQLVWGPLSDALGRKPILMFGLITFMLASASIALVGSGAWLIIFRIIQGIAGAAPAAVLQGLIRDRYSRDDFSRVMSFVTLVVTLAPMVAPLVGGLILQVASWRAIFWVLVVASFLIAILCYWQIEESVTYKYRPELGIVLRNYLQIFRTQGVVWYMGISGFSFAGMFIFLTSGSFVYMQQYGLSETQFGLFFAQNVFFLMLMTSVNSRFVKRVGAPNMLKIGVVLQMLAGLLIVLGAMLSNNIWLLAVPVSLFIAMMSTIGSNSMACLMDQFPEKAGTAGAAAATFRFGVGGAIGFVVSLLPVTAVFMAASMLASSIIGLLCLLMLPKLAR
ncbi:Bcr/CflA family multidrug efflux MFS transporter [Salinibius halmophilus]|uniref:Bcr/CflA family multidrug efflux MFS transporter n=1 Tax=Salinibius halmophilus TaxID=1853216 RepID=UPI000E66FEFE|nr:Bcr/CflA family multidrug efflux MFS transporter [Salinibius halmophilus]